MRTALFLIVLGFGYKIFVEASEKQKKSLKQLGQVVGVILMAASLCGAAYFTYRGLCKSCGWSSSSIYYPNRGYDKSGYGMDHHGSKSGKMLCPMMGQSDSPKESEKTEEIAKTK